MRLIREGYRPKTKSTGRDYQDMFDALKLVSEVYNLGYSDVLEVSDMVKEYNIEDEFFEITEEFLDSRVGSSQSPLDLIAIAYETLSRKARNLAYAIDNEFGDKLAEILEEVEVYGNYQDSHLYISGALEKYESLVNMYPEEMEGLEPELKDILELIE